MISLLSYILMTVAFLFQTTVLADLFLLRGTSDIVLLFLLASLFQARTDAIWGLAVYSGLMIGIASELPIWLPIVQYLGIIGLVKYTQRFIWQSPILLLLVSVMAGTLIIYLVDYIYLLFFGFPLEVSVPFADAFNLVILPGMILNLILSLPVYGFVGEVLKLGGLEEAGI